MVKQWRQFKWESIVEFKPVGVLNIELTSEVLEWKDFSYFNHSIDVNVHLAEYAFNEYKNLTEFVYNWSNYKNRGSKGTLVTIRITVNLTFYLANFQQKPNRKISSSHVVVATSLTCQYTTPCSRQICPCCTNLQQTIYRFRTNL